MFDVHPALLAQPLSYKKYLSQSYIPELGQFSFENKRFENKHRSATSTKDKATHEIISSFIRTSRLSKDFIAIFSKGKTFKTGSFEDDFKHSYTGTHGNLVNLAYRNILNQSKILTDRNLSEFLMQPLEAFIILRESNKDYFNYFLQKLGCEDHEYCSVHNSLSMNFLDQLKENRIYNFQYSIVRNLSYAVKYALFLDEQFGSTKISDEALVILSRLSVLGDIGNSQGLKNLTQAHIRQTEELLCKLYARQLELICPGNDTNKHFFVKPPESLESICIKPEFYIEKNAAAKKGVFFTSQSDYLKFLDATRTILALQIEKNLPGVSSHIGIYCLQNAADKACFIAGAKKAAKYSMRAASLFMSATRFAATWVP